MGCNCQSLKNGLNDYQVSPLSNLTMDWSGFFQRSLAYIAGGDYDKAINTIEYRMAWNDFSWYNPATWGNPEYRRIHIEKILNSYTNYILETDTNIEYYDEWKAKSNDPVMLEFLNAISDIAGVQKDLTRRVLDHLVWATLDGSIKDKTIWKPRLNKYYEMRTKIPEKADSVYNSKLMQGGLSFMNNLDWILPVALIGAGLYIVYPYLRVARATTEATSAKN